MAFGDKNRIRRTALDRAIVDVQRRWKVDVEYDGDRVTMGEVLRVNLRTRIVEIMGASETFMVQEYATRQQCRTMLNKYFQLDKRVKELAARMKASKAQPAML